MIAESTLTSEGSDARAALSGKRVALLGLPPEIASEWSRIIQDADGFTRLISPRQVEPPSDVLKPFELFLLNIETATGTHWLSGANASIHSRCIAVGDVPALLHLASEPSLEFAEYLSVTATPDELLLRCALGLRSRPKIETRSLLNPTTVVLADDDTSVTSIVRRALERNGLTCQVASTGNDALSLITRLKPGSAVLDVHMPAMDGFELLSRIKGAPDLAHARVILLTGSEQEADIIRGFTLGADDYICKPFNPMELTIRLMRAIGRI